MQCYSDRSLNFGTTYFILLATLADADLDSRRHLANDNVQRRAELTHAMPVRFLSECLYLSR